MILLNIVSITYLLLIKLHLLSVPARLEVKVFHLFMEDQKIRLTIRSGKSFAVNA